MVGAPMPEDRLPRSPVRESLVSIVTPSLNQARYLPDALASVRKQQWPHEHIVVDGGSDDGSVEILRHGSGRVRCVVEQDEGQSNALNKGLAMARGTVVGWLNSDDFYLPGAFEAVADYLAANPHVDVAYGDAVVVDDEGRVIRGLQQHGFDERVLLYYGCFIPSTSAFFRGNLIDNGLLHLDETLHLAMDLELFLRLARHGVRFGHMRRDLAAFRWHEAAKTLTDSRGGLQEKRQIQRQYGALGLDGPAEKVLHWYFQTVHGVRKLMTGAYWRELRWHSARGRSLLPQQSHREVIPPPP